MTGRIPLSELPQEIIEKIFSQGCVQFEEVKQFLFYSSTYKASLNALYKRSIVEVELDKSIRDFNKKFNSGFYEDYVSDEEDTSIGLKSVNLSTKQFIQLCKTQKNILNIRTFKFTIPLNMEINVIYNELNEIIESIALINNKEITLNFINRSNIPFLSILSKSIDMLSNMIACFNGINNKIRLELNQADFTAKAEIELVNPIKIATKYVESLNLYFEPYFQHSVQNNYDLTIEVSDSLKELRIANIDKIIPTSYPHGIKLNVVPSNNLKILSLKSSLQDSGSFNYEFLKEFPRLEELDLISSHIQDINQLISDYHFPNLRILNMNYNRIDSINNISFTNFAPNLIELSIEDQQPTSKFYSFIDVSLPNSLKVIKLSGNKIKSVKHVKSASLTCLDLSRNYINEFNLFNNEVQSSINKLFLSYNKSIIQNICRFSNMQFSSFLFSNIIELYLDGCNISNEDLERLTDFYELTTITSPLQVLSLSNNKLSNLRCFSSNLYLSLPLRKLDLSFNKFTYLNNENLPINIHNFPLLKTINFKGNINLERVYNLELNHDYLTINFQYTKAYEISNNNFGGSFINIIR